MLIEHSEGRDTGRWLTYGELGDLVTRTAHALTRAGVTRGSRVGVLLPNSELFTLGCLLGGAAVVVGTRFQPFSFWESVRRHQARAFNYVGTMIPLLIPPPRAPG